MPEILQNTTKSDKPYLPYLQILRFFAATLVLFGHVQQEIGHHLRDSAEHFVPLTFMDWGLGVDIFFVISGFIMYFLTSDCFGQPHATLNFLTRRIRRVVPMYWLFTSLMIVAMLLFASHVTHFQIVPLHVVLSYLFFPWPRADGELFPVLALGWTLNYEMFFYLIYAMALLFPKRIGLTLLAASFAALVAMADLMPQQMQILKFFGQPIIFEFLFGIVCAMVLERGIRISLPAGLFLVFAGLAGAVMMKSFGIGQYTSRAITGGLPATLIFLGFALVKSNYEEWRFSRALSLGGDASYALYLSHPFSIIATAICLSRLPVHSPWIDVATMMSAAFAVAVAVHFLIERRLFIVFQQRRIILT